MFVGPAPGFFERPVYACRHCQERFLYLHCGPLLGLKMKAYYSSLPPGHYIISSREFCSTECEEAHRRCREATLYR